MNNSVKLSPSNVNTSNDEVIVEFVSFKTKPSISPSAFIGIVSELEETFHSIQSGFIDTLLLQENHKADSWIMIQHWRDFDALKNASSALMRSTVTKSFRDALEPSSVSMSFFTECGHWESDRMSGDR